MKEEKRANSREEQAGRRTRFTNSIRSTRLAPIELVCVLLAARCCSSLGRSLSARRVVHGLLDHRSRCSRVRSACTNPAAERIGRVREARGGPHHEARLNYRTIPHGRACQGRGYSLVSGSLAPARGEVVAMTVLLRCSSPSTLGARLSLSHGARPRFHLLLPLLLLLLLVPAARDGPRCPLFWPERLLPLSLSHLRAARPPPRPGCVVAGRRMPQGNT